MLKCREKLQLAGLLVLVFSFKVYAVAPVWSNCPSNININTDDGTSSGTASWTEPIVSDDMTSEGDLAIVVLYDSAIQTYPPTSFSFGIGTTEVRYQATDDENSPLTGVCTFSVIVTDNEAPVISNCPTAEIIEVTDVGENDKVVTWTATSANDNSGSDVSKIQSTAEPGDVFEIGTTLVTITYQDPYGNLAECIFNVTILDQEDPEVFNCPESNTEIIDQSINSSTSTWFLPTFTDNDEVSTTVSNYEPGDSFNVGITEVVYTATDPSGNERNCSFNITVLQDKEPPVFSYCPNDTIVSTLPGVNYTVVNWTSPIASDDVQLASVRQASTDYSTTGERFYIGPTQIRYIAVDVLAKTSQCIFDIIVNDNEDPSINCSSNFTITTELDQPFATVIYYVSAEDNDGFLPNITTSNPASGSQLDIGVTSFIISATDRSGNTAECSFYVTVSDDQAPNVTFCPSNLEFNTEAGTNYAIVTWQEPTAIDNSGTVEVSSQTHTNGSRFYLESSPYTVIYTFEDNSSNSDVCSFEVTVIDKEPPVTNCSADISSTTSTGMAVAVGVTLPVISFEDNSGMTVNVSQNIESPSDFPIGSTMIEVNGTDEYGNTAVCRYYVNVTDDEDPAITCPDNQTLPADQGSIGRQVTWSTPNATDNSGDVTVTLADGDPASGNTFTLGAPRILTYIATDSSGNTATCTFAIHIIDVYKRQIMNCPSAIVNETDPSVNSTSVTWTEPTYSDNTNETSLVTESTHDSGDTFYIGVTTVIYTVTDESGNVATCNFTVTILDMEPPTYNCSDDISENTLPGVDYASVTWQAPTYDDNSFKNVILTFSHMQPVDLKIGIHEIVYNFTDESGNQASCSFTVTINDFESPNVSFCPVNLENTTAFGLPYQNVSWELPIVSDNNGWFSTVSTHEPYDGFSIGTTEVTYTFTDQSNNTATCIFNVTIKDEENPIISCPSNFSLTTELDQPYAIAVYNVSAEDNDGLPPTISTSDPESGDQIGIGIQKYFITATDQSGNTDNCSFYIIVADEQDPNVTYCPGDFEVNTETGRDYAIATWREPTANDNSGTVEISYQTHTNGSTFSLTGSPHTVMYNFTDNSSNTAMCIFKVTVIDDELPTTNCTGDINISASLNMTYAINVSLPTITFEDNSGLAVNVTQNVESPYDFPIGITYVVVNGTDQFGNTAVCRFSVNVTDIEDPEITCPDNQTLPAEQGSVGRLVTWITPTATDNSQDVPTVTLADGDPASGNTFTLGAPRILTYIATDSSGNTATCTFAIHIIDIEDPEITCPDNQTLPAEQGSVGRLVTWITPTATDNSQDVPTVTLADGDPASGNTFTLGAPRILTYIATDGSGNTATCTFAIHIIDEESPVFMNCPSAIINETDPSVNSTSVTWTEPTYSDNTDEASLVTESTHDSGDTFYIGVTTVIYTVTDESGNVGTCNFTVTVLDMEPPTYNCSDDISENTFPGVDYASVTWQAPTYNDNSFQEVIVTNQMQPIDLKVGIHEIVYNFTDESGNQASCSFTVTVNDFESPNVSFCPGSLENTTAFGLPYQNVSWELPIVSDNNGWFSTVSTHEPYDGFSIGITEVTYTFTDQSNNTATCIFNVTIKDKENPIISCSSNFSLTTEPDQLYATVVYNVSAEDNDGLPPTITTSDPDSGDQIGIGIQGYFITATDQSGNIDNCSFYVTVTDEQDPNVTYCPGDFEVNTETGKDYAIATWREPTAYDNSGTVEISYQTHTNGSMFSLTGSPHTVMYNFTDNSANTAMCIFRVTVIDDELPTTNCTSDINISASLNMTYAINVSLPTIVFEDNSGLAVDVTQNVKSPYDFPIGITYVVVNGTDQFGNIAVCRFSVNVTDVEDPEITCPDNQTLPAEQGSVGRLVTWITPTATDNSQDVPTVTLADGDPTSGNTFTLGAPRILTYIATDGSGNTATCTFAIHIIDEESPVIMNCPSAIVNETDPSVNSTSVSWAEPNYSDNTNTASLLSESTHDSGDTFYIGVTTVVYTVTDESGNVGTCNFTVTILDIEPPTYNCSNDISENTLPGVDYASVTWQAPTYDDNSFKNVIVAFSHMQPVDLTTGIHEIVYNFTDESGNQASCSFTVTINDFESPNVSFCPVSLENTTALGLPYQNVSWELPIVSDNNGWFSTMSTHEPYDGFSIGTTEVTYTFTDQSNNTATCIFNVTIKDEENPTISCSSNFSLTTEPDQAYAIAVYNVSAEDNDGLPPTIFTSDPESGNQIGIGIQGFFITATDQSGNIDTCSFYVTITDEQGPNVTYCPGDFEVNTETGKDYAIATWREPTAYDNSGTVEISYQTHPNGSMFSLTGSPHLVMYIFTDNSSNTAVCTFNVTVIDNEDPTTNCTVDISFSASTNESKAINVTLPTITFEDNSGEPVDVTQNIYSQSDLPLGITVIVVNGTDMSGNTATCEYTVNVTDNQPPIAIDCPSNISQTTDFGSSNATVNFTEVTFIDNSEVMPTVTVTGVNPNDQYEIGETDIEYMAVDSSGNVAVCSFTITVIDDMDPILQCFDVMNTTIPETAFGIIDEYSITVIENSQSYDISYTIQPGVSFSIGKTQVTATATDSSENTGNCTFNVTIIDDEIPSVYCPMDITVPTDDASYNATIDFIAPNATDNSGGNLTIYSNFKPGDTFPFGVTTVSYTFQDESFNTAECIFNVTVYDDEDPMIVCPMSQKLNTTTDSAYALNVIWSDPVAIDNAPSIQIMCVPASNSNFTVGTTDVICSAIDPSNNQGKCNFTIEVSDNQDPILDCNVTETYFTPPWSATVTLSNVIEYDDNVAIDTVSQSPESGYALPIGETLVTNIVNDTSGNTVSCSVTVIVIDNVPPVVVNCPSSFNVSTDPGSDSTTVIWTEPTATDNDGTLPSVTVNHENATLLSIGMYDIQYEFKDLSNNTTPCTFQVIVYDDEPPTTNDCPTDQVVPNTMGLDENSAVSWTAVTFGDNSGGFVDVDVSPGMPPQAFKIGTGLVEYTATDTHGNIGYCRFNVTVYDGEDPVIDNDCPDDIINTTEYYGNQNPVVYWDVPTASDNSGSVNRTSTHNPGDIFQIGDSGTVVRYTFSDNAGNMAMCEFRVIIADLIHPVLYNISGNLTYYTLPGVDYAIAMWDDPMAVDNSGITIVATTIPSGSQFTIGTTRVCVLALDPSDNGERLCFYVTVIDNERPVISNYQTEEIIRFTDPGTPIAVTWQIPTVTDNSGMWNVSSNFDPGDTFDVGEYLIFYNATDPYGNEASITFTVTVLETDNIPPNITCPDPVIVPTDESRSYASGVSWSGIYAYDLNGIYNISSSIQNGSRFDLGLTNVTYWVYDNAGNTAECTFIVTVLDMENPVVTNCPDNITDTTETGENYGIVNIPSLMVSENSGSYVVSQWPMGSQFSISTTPVTITITDDAANSATCEFLVTIIDDEDPKIIFCPTNILMDNDPQLSTAVVNWTEPTADDNHGIASLQQSHISGVDVMSVGDNLVNYTWIDHSGNTVTCLFTVTVRDVEDPVYSGCPTSQIQVETPTGFNTTTVYWTPPTVNDNVGVVINTSDYQPNDIFEIGITTVTYHAEDEAGNEANCIFTILVEDTENPVFTTCSQLQPSITVQTLPGLNYSSASWSVPVAIDNDLITGVDSNAEPGDQFPFGSTAVLYTAYDDSGNTGTCSFLVIVEDNEKPEISQCPNDTTILPDFGQNSAEVVWDEPIVTDNVDETPTVISNIKSNTSLIIGAHIVRYTAIDQSGNSETCMFTVTVLDGEPPEFMDCPGNITQPTDEDKRTARVTWAPPMATDNAGTPFTVSNFQPNDEFVYLFGGANPVIYTAFDLSGNTGFCIFYVTVTDDQSPVFTTQPPNITLTADESGPTAIATWNQPVVDDNVGVIAVVPEHLSGSPFNIGVTDVTIVAYDAAGNQASVMFYVTVYDDTPPVYTNCPGQRNFNTDVGLNTSSVVWRTLVIQDNDQVNQEYNSHLSPVDLPVGTHTIYNNVTDRSGNYAECIFEVVVTDNEDPTYEVCPNSFTVIASPSSNETQVSWTVSSPSDNVQIVSETMTYSSNDIFAIGTYTIRYEATDSSGNTGICEFTLAVQDATAPTFSNCPSSQTLSTDPGVDGTNVFWSTPTAMDNSGNVMTVIMTPVLTSGNYLQIGQYNVNFTAVDAGGNIGYCFFTILIEDTEFPNVTYCPDDFDTLPDNGTNTANPMFETPTAVDNSGILITEAFPVSGAVFMPGLNTVLYTFTDPSGNIARCSFTVTVRDDEAPMVTGCPSSIEESTRVGLSYSIINWTEPVFMDNAGEPLVVRTHDSGSQFSIGITYVNYTASDSFGNQRLCSFAVTILDDELPVITNCPSNQQLTITTSGDTAIATWTTPDATDNSGQPGLSSNYPSGYPFPVGMTDVIYEARDASGNGAQCTFVITVNDNQPPNFENCPSEIEANTDFRQPTATVSWTEPFAVDNVDGNLTFTSTYSPGFMFPVGVYTNSYEATDREGNIGNCVFTITVFDREKPQILNCPTGITVTSSNIARWAPPRATDNTVLVTLLSTVNPGSTLPSGTTSVTYTAYDQYRNEEYCIFSINVQGIGAPVITYCPDSQVVVADEGALDAEVSWITPNATDNGTALTPECNYLPGSEFDVETRTDVICVFTASTGLESICRFSVNVEAPPDLEDPVLSSCPPNQNIEAELGSTSAVATWTPPSATDNSNISPTLEVTNEPGSNFDIGETVVLYIARDSSGNTDSCQFKITVSGFIDNTDPVIEDCPSNINEFVSVGTTTYPVGWDPPTATDDSGSLDFETDYEPGSSFNAGETTLVTYTATDTSNNEVLCTFTVTITVDTQSPTVTNCPVAIDETILSGETSTVVTWTSPTVQDNSGDYSVEPSIASGSVFDVGEETVVYSISDNYGNTNNDCSFKVTVSVDEVPSFNFCPESSTVNTEPDLATGIAMWGMPMANDAEDGTIIPTSTSTSGQPFNLGSNPVVYTATDSSNQQAECTFYITVIDNQDPEFITTPDPPVVWVLAGSSSGIVSWAVPTVNDNADPNPTVSLTGGTNGGSFPLGTNPLTYTATDDAGNFVTYSFDAIVYEDLPPMFTYCPESSTEYTDIGLATATVSWNMPTAEDERDGTITPTSTSVSGQQFGFASNRVTYIAVDSSSQTTECVFFITVLDNQDPQITNIIPPVPVTAALGATSAVVTWPEPTVSDNVDPSPSVLLTGGVNGGTFNIGTTDLSYTVTDSSGNSISYDFEVVVNEFPPDATEPVFTFCPGAVTANNSPGLSTGEVTWTLPVATDDGGDVAVTPAFSSGTYPIGTTSVVYSATDGVNTVTCTVIVQVIDNEKPTIDNCPETMNYYVPSSSTSVLIIWDEPTASDNLAVTSFTPNMNSGTRRTSGTETITYTALDAASNMQTCSFVVNILVETNPRGIQGSVIMDEIRGVDGLFSTASANLLISQLQQDLDDLFRSSDIRNDFVDISISTYDFNDENNAVVIFNIDLISSSALDSDDIEDAFYNALSGGTMFASDNSIQANTFFANLISLEGSVTMDEIRGVDGTFSTVLGTTLISQLQGDLYDLFRTTDISSDFAGISISSNEFDDNNNVLIEFVTYLVASSTVMASDIEAAFYGALTDETMFATDNAIEANTFIVGEDICTNSPCQNGGVCQRVGSTYSCMCTDGYEGDNCQSGRISTCFGGFRPNCSYDSVIADLLEKYLEVLTPATKHTGFT
ncbi:uncharacterized protein LOC117103264 [Anneissia japonica]|uniref:uncharacterized protein LOC117103264 n=1 Tax=Anneissia japonica TaxID=1529436 RepID=UPI001425A3E5|nr:uncharacterized protein LOC117103264 [Anneissia japonica]